MDISDPYFILDYYRSLFEPEKCSSPIDNYRSRMICEFCDVELIIDAKSYYNVCPNCCRGFPYCDYINEKKRFSPCYKRKWHMMTVIRKNNYRINGYEIDKVMNLYKELDRLYFKMFPKKNMVYLPYVLQYICRKLDLNHIVDQIRINRNDKILKSWKDRLNLVMSQK